MSGSLYLGIDGAAGLPSARAGVQRGWRGAPVLPGSSLTPAADLLPQSQPFASWRVLMRSASTVASVPAGATRVLTANVWASWDYRTGVNPEAEPLPLLEAGSRIWIDQSSYTLTAPVWPSGPGNGPVAWLFEPPLTVDTPAGSVVWLFIERSRGACRMLDADALRAERLNATLIALGDAINRLAGELWVTWEGAPAFDSKSMRAGAVACASAYLRPWEDADGDFRPALLERAATATLPGLVMQAPAVADATWSATSTGTLWETLAALQAALGSAGWLEVGT